MNLKRLGQWWASAALGLCLGLSLVAQPAFGASSFTLQGQSKGNTNWIAGNLQNWGELEYIPCRLLVGAGSQGSNQVITINFEHMNGKFQGIQNLYSFTSSSNVVIRATPVLSAPSTDGTWSY